ncbi:MAG: baseplate J/gp47 family protein [Ruminiclostridium sp.]|nr:baseplate J/gp47 family protein [Ruminiclostridium sp.]
MYEEVTVEGILSRMLGRVSDKLDKREGSVIADSLSPAAMEIMALYIELERVLKEGFGDSASREFLALRCRERGIVPYPAEKAQAKGVFEPKSVDVLGKRFSAGEVNFTAAEKMSDGVYRMECETAGREGNRFFGEMIPIDYVEGLERAELVEILIPGEDEEDTEDLRKRYFASFDEKAFGGNVQDYIEKTNAISGVGSVKVKRVWNDDLRPAEMIPSEAVEKWYSLVKGTLSGESKKWLEAVFLAAKDKKLTTGGTVLLTVLNSDFGTASDTLVQAVQRAVDPDEYSGEGYGFAPIGHIVKVKSAEGVNVRVSTEIVFEEGYSWDNLKDAVEGAVSDYLLELRKAWADEPYLIVRVSQIDTRILGIKGVVDVGNTLINGSADNLVLGEYQVPVLDSVFGGENK